MKESRVEFSVVIPTYGREHYVRKLLSSLHTARANYDSEVEVIVVDSSDQTAAQHIAESCEKYDAIYREGKQSVRWKRNHGVRQSRFSIVMFIDSDCEVDEDIFREHARVYRSGVENLGGVYGLTQFVGKRSCLWRIIELTSFVDVFAFAERFPYVQWAIGNNVSYCRSVFDETGGFEENFPFRLGGDDLDLSLRVTKSGHLIKTNPKAVTYHTRDTWNSWRALLERAIRWGRMEYYICRNHRELPRRDLPRQEPLFLLFAIFSLILAALSRSVVPIFGLVLWAMLAYLFRSLLDHLAGQRRPLLYHSLAQIPGIVYQFACIFEHLRHKRLGILYKRMIFSVHHIQAIWSEEVRRMWASLLAFWTVLLLCALSSQ
jgi:glycosyltransferase involved in cell wall biosynthesis